MLLNNSIHSICTNSMSFAIHGYFKRVRGILKCSNSYEKDLINWLLSYISRVNIIYDIVPRAVMANVENSRPTARTNKQKFSIAGIECFDAINNIIGAAYAIASQNIHSAVRFLLCKKLEGEVCYV